RVRVPEGAPVKTISFEMVFFVFFPSVAIFSFEEYNQTVMNTGGRCSQFGFLFMEISFFGRKFIS
ncbi:MAG: hypothetical protein VZR13_03705, partial [Saccharofermentanaceae bacterium]|nr:hypothetical protein [Saccharofermentanaceae bacterium]